MVLLYFEPARWLFGRFLAVLPIQQMGQMSARPMHSRAAIQRNVTVVSARSRSASRSLNLTPLRRSRGFSPSSPCASEPRGLAPPPALRRSSPIPPHSATLRLARPSGPATPCEIAGRPKTSQTDPRTNAHTVNMRLCGTDPFTGLIGVKRPPRGSAEFALEDHVHRFGWSSAEGWTPARAAASGSTLINALVIFSSNAPFASAPISLSPSTNSHYDPSDTRLSASSKTGRVFVTSELIRQIAMAAMQRS